MTRTVGQVRVLRCHRCSYFIGETDRVLEFVGVVKRARETDMIDPPRQSWVCPKCRWTNIFRRPREVAV